MDVLKINDDDDDDTFVFVGSCDKQIQLKRVLVQKGFEPSSLLLFIGFQIIIGGSLTTTLRCQFRE